MASSPRFSVIIATYNRRQYVLETIQSVKEQTYQYHEIIVVVDGSQDGTSHSIRQAHPDVIVYEQPNLGRSVARNTGVALSSGDWVCFIDDDDLWHKDKLKATATYIDLHPLCQAINNPVWFFCETEDGPVGGFGFHRDFTAKNLYECHQAVEQGDISHNEVEYLKIHGNSFNLLLERNRGVMSATVIRRDILIRAGCFCPMQSYGEDWSTFVNVARFGEWHTLSERLGFTRLHDAQSSLDFSNALITLSGIVNAWYTGRPFPQHTTFAETHDKLANYGATYRKAVQLYYWGALRNRQFHIASLIKQVGRMLLPKNSDLLYAMTPPQITWRWERHILGMHK